MATEREVESIQSQIGLVDVAGKLLGRVGVLGVASMEAVTDGSVILPLSQAAVDHNQMIAAQLTNQAQIVSIIDHNQLSFEGTAARFNNKNTGIKGKLLNTLFSNPGVMFSVPDLKTSISPNIGTTVTGFMGHFNEPPLLRVTRNGKNFSYVGLNTDVVIRDQRQNPQDALEIARKNVSFDTGPDEWSASKVVLEPFGEPSRFVTGLELELALQEQRIIRFTNIEQLNQMTQKYIEERRPGLVPNVISILSDTRLQINNVDFPTGPLAQRALNRLLASYMSPMRSIEQIFAVTDDYTLRAAESFLLPIQNTGWIKGALIHDKKMLLLAPSIIKDYR